MFESTFAVCKCQVGPEGAGHFVKMVHNGIEYGDMQLICEAYQLMKQALGMSNDEISDVCVLSLNLFIVAMATVHASQDRRAGVQGTAQPLACIPGGRLPTCVCHWTLTTAVVGHRHVPSAANQHTFWRSLICCCWTSSMEQSANPAVSVSCYTRTILTSTRNASICSLSAAAPSDSVFRALCTNWLTYLL